MYTLLKWFVVLAPLQLVGVGLGGVYIQGASLVAAAIACYGGMQFLLGNMRLSPPADRWAWPFLLFVIAAAGSLATSPYLREAGVKGLVQLLGVSTMLLFAVTFAHVCSRKPSWLLTVLRYSSASLGAVGLIGVIQSVVNNAAGGAFFSLEFLNPILGLDWRDPGGIGGFRRANSLVSEPAHLATFLVAGLGLALIRFGLFGAVARSPEVRYVMPGWAAVGIVGGITVSMSVVGYAGMIMVVIAIRFLAIIFGRRKSVRRRSWTYRARAAGGIGAVAIVALVAGQPLLDKLQTTTLISEAGVLAEQGTVRDFIITENVSALAIAVNLEIAVKNFMERPMLGAGIGAHPTTYDLKAPDYAFLSPIVYGLNRDEAASLLLRLVSETGWFGTGLFLLGLLLVLWTGWVAIRAYSTFAGGSEHFAGWRAIGIGLLASYAAVSALFLMRMGVYFSSTLWCSIALVIAFAALTARVTASLTRRTVVSTHPRPLEHPAE
jgi:hypothetical protein